MDFRARKSWKFYQGGLKYLGGGGSTLSRKPVFKNIEPAIIVRGRGCRVWDADGNEYIDFRSGLGPVTLGYGFESVNRAIMKQMEKGITFGHPSALEIEAARILVESIPCARRVRFLKTGGEAVAACIKTARAATGRKKIIHCGYNGWLNRLSDGGNLPRGIASSQFYMGVPSEISRLHISMPWGNIAEWEKCLASDGEDIAAVVIACDYGKMNMGYEFLPAVRKLTRKYGVLMVMDEIVTGFRLALGGAHQYFSFMPDMAVFSKGVANGMPVSAYAGKASLIDLSASAGVSSTFGGEMLSLAAVLATVKVYQEQDVISHLWKVGEILQQGVNALFREYGFPASLEGFPVCPRFTFEKPGLRELFFKGCYTEGVSFYDVPYVNFSHKKRDIEEVIEKLECVLRRISGRDA